MKTENTDISVENDTEFLRFNQGRMVKVTDSMHEQIMKRVREDAAKQTAGK